MSLKDICANILYSYTLVPWETKDGKKVAVGLCSFIFRHLFSILFQQAYMGQTHEFRDRGTHNETEKKDEEWRQEQKVLSEKSDVALERVQTTPDKWIALLFCAPGDYVTWGSGQDHRSSRFRSRGHLLLRKIHLGNQIGETKQAVIQ